MGTSAKKPTDLNTLEPADAFDKFDAKTTSWSAYNARALVYASDLAYKDDNTAMAACAKTWGFDQFDVIASDSSILQAVIMGSPAAIVVAFRGTRPDQLSDWMADFEIVQTPFTKYFSAPNVGAVHDGFARLLAGRVF